MTKDNDAGIDAGLPGADWVTRYGGPGDDQGTAIAVAPNGDIVMVGAFTGTMTLGGSPISSVSSRDVWVARYAPDGSHLWSVRLGGLNDNYGTGVAVDGKGDVYVVGMFYGPVNFGGGYRNIQAGGFLVKLAAASGAYRWDRVFVADVMTVAILDANTVAIGGGFGGTVDFGGGNLTAMGAGDSYVAAYNVATGAPAWSKALNTSGGSPPTHEFAHIVAVGGDAIVAASFAGTATTGGNILTARGSTDILIARYHGADGTYLWSRSLQQGSSQGQVLSLSSIATDGDHIFLGGVMGGTVNLGGSDMTATGRLDAFVASCSSSDGTHVWSQRFGGTVVTDAASLAVSPTRLAANISFSNESITIGTQTFVADNTDVAIVRLNPSTGVPILVTQFGSPANDFMSLVYAFDRLFGVGTFSTEVDLFGTHLISDSGSGDIASFRLDF